MFTKGANIQVMLFAPNGTVTVLTSMNVKGSIVGQVLNDQGSAVITHDSQVDAGSDLIGGFGSQRRASCIVHINGLASRCDHVQASP